MENKWISWTILFSRENVTFFGKIQKKFHFKVLISCFDLGIDIPGIKEIYQDVIVKIDNMTTFLHVAVSQIMTSIYIFLSVGVTIFKYISSNFSSESVQQIYPAAWVTCFNLNKINAIQISISSKFSFQFLKFFSSKNAIQLEDTVWLFTVHQLSNCFNV